MLGSEDHLVNQERVDGLTVLASAGEVQGEGLVHGVKRKREEVDVPSMAKRARLGSHVVGPLSSPLLPPEVVPVPPPPPTEAPPEFGPKMVSLVSGVVGHKGPQDIPCGYEGCTYTSVKASRIYNHRRTHSVDRPFKCEWENCQYAAKDMSTMRQHKQRHKGEKPIVCGHQGCTYASNLMSHVTRHRRTHTGEKPFKCKECSYASAQKVQLDRHLRKHTGLAFVCEVEGCEFTTTKEYQAQNHKREHRGEAPLQCQFDGCTYTSFRPNTMRVHERKHTGEKPYVCPHEGCPFACAGSSNLAAHQRTHSGDMPYRCNIDGCTYGSSQARNVKAHRQHIHGVEVNPLHAERGLLGPDMPLDLLPSQSALVHSAVPHMPQPLGVPMHPRASLTEPRPLHVPGDRPPLPLHLDSSLVGGLPMPIRPQHPVHVPSVQEMRSSGNS